MFNSDMGIYLLDMFGNGLADWVHVHMLWLLVYLFKEDLDEGRESPLKEPTQALVGSGRAILVGRGFVLKVNLNRATRHTVRQCV